MVCIISLEQYFYLVFCGRSLDPLTSLLMLTELTTDIRNRSYCICGACFLSWRRSLFSQSFYDLEDFKQPAETFRRNSYCLNRHCLARNQRYPPLYRLSFTTFTGSLPDYRRNLKRATFQVDSTEGLAFHNHRKPIHASIQHTSKPFRVSTQNICPRHTKNGQPPTIPPKTRPKLRLPLAPPPRPTEIPHALLQDPTPHPTHALPPNRLPKSHLHFHPKLPRRQSQAE